MIENSEDEKVRLFDADQKVVAARTLTEMARGLMYVNEQIAADVLTPELGTTVLSLVELKLADVSTLLGLPTQTQASIDERYHALRTANERIQALERELGERSTPESLKLGVKTMADQLRERWSRHGLGHVSELAFTEHGNCKAKLSCALFGGFSLLGSDTPVSDEQLKAKWFQELRGLGFVLGRKEGIVDCDASRAALYSMIAKCWPGATIVDLQSHLAYPEKMLCMRYVEIMLHDLGDISAGAVRDEEG